MISVLDRLTIWIIIKVVIQVNIFISQIIIIKKITLLIIKDYRNYRVFKAYKSKDQMLTINHFQSINSNLKTYP